MKDESAEWEVDPPPRMMLLDDNSPHLAGRHVAHLERLARTRDGQPPEPIVEFPYAELDRANPLTAELSGASGDKIPELADAFASILGWVWRGGASSRKQIHAAMVRFTAFSACMRPDLLDDLSYQAIGKMFKVTKQAVSMRATEFQRTFSVHFRRGRRKGAIRKFRRVQKELWRSGRRARR